jgi:hypothetical protein
MRLVEVAQLRRRRPLIRPAAPISATAPGAGTTAISKSVELPNEPVV